METTINTFNEFKEYKEKKVREFIRNYKGITYGWIFGICVIVDLLLIISKFIAKVDITRVPICYLLTSIAITFFAWIKYYRARCIKKLVYNCLIDLSCYEDKVRSKIEIDNLKAQMKDNIKEIDQLECSIRNLDLKCEIINKTIRINYCKSFICTIFCMNLDEYKIMIKNKKALLQEKYNYRQLQNKYETDIQLLRKTNEDLNKKIKEDQSNDINKNQTIINKDIKLNLNLYNKFPWNITKLLFGKNLKEEIKILFIDLVEVVSQIKIK